MSMSSFEDRIASIDFIKGLMVVLMVAFHLPLSGYVADATPYVYTFHMPVFLVISGFFLKVDRSYKSYKKSLLRIAVPYVIFQTLYIFAIGLLQHYVSTSNTIENLGIGTIAYHVFLRPCGTYWYLHTLLIYAIVIKVSYELTKGNWLHTLLCSLTCLVVLDKLIVGFDFTNAVYLSVGVIANYLRTKTKLNVSSLYALFPVVAVFSFSSLLSRSDLASGFIVTLLMISFCTALYEYIPNRMKLVMNFLGRNSLCIVVFSSYYNMGVKMIAPYWAFEPTGLLLAFVGTTIVIGLCLITKKVLNKWHFNYI